MAKRAAATGIDPAIDIASLRTFAAVMRTGSFSAAAREQNVAPSIISRSIAGLEEKLQMRLFERTTRSVVATDAARLFCDRVEAALDDIERAHEEIAQGAGQLGGSIRVTTSVAFGERCLIPLLPAFAEKFPQLTVELLLTDSVVNVVTERIDLAIRLGALPDSTLVATKVMDTHYRVCASPAYLRRVAEIREPVEVQQHRCLVSSVPGFGTQWTFRSRRGKNVRVPVRGRLVCSNAMALYQCAVAGMGLALLPGWLTDSDVRQGSLVDVFPQFTVKGVSSDTAVWLLRPSRNYVPAKVRAMSEYLSRELRPKAGTR